MNEPFTKDEMDKRWVELLDYARKNVQDLEAQLALRLAGYVDHKRLEHKVFVIGDPRHKLKWLFDTFKELDVARRVLFDLEELVRGNDPRRSDLEQKAWSAYRQHQERRSAHDGGMDPTHLSRGGPPTCAECGGVAEGITGTDEKGRALCASCVGIG